MKRRKALGGIAVAICAVVTLTGIALLLASFGGAVAYGLVGFMPFHKPGIVFMAGFCGASFGAVGIAMSLDYMNGKLQTTRGRRV